MYERFFVPVDGSDISHRALTEAIKIAPRPQGRARVVYVIEDLRAWYTEGLAGLDSILEATRKQGQNALAKAEALAQNSGVQIESSLLQANGQRIATVIVEEAKRWPADVIVMGTHGRSGFNHMIFGSVAEGVLRTATVPILLIRGE